MVAFHHCAQNFDSYVKDTHDKALHADGIDRCNWRTPNMPSYLVASCQGPLRSAESKNRRPSVNNTIGAPKKTPAGPSWSSHHRFALILPLSYMSSLRIAEKNNPLLFPPRGCSLLYHALVIRTYTQSTQARSHPIYKKPDAAQLALQPRPHSSSLS
jgi:hypothetical protein